VSVRHVGEAVSAPSLQMEIRRWVSKVVVEVVVVYNDFVVTRMESMALWRRLDGEVEHTWSEVDICLAMARLACSTEERL
jgi:hypothetical protein